MEILLCWSKERSRLLAIALRDWLPKVLPNLSPWMSEVDLDKGKDWSDGLHGILGRAKAAIICITPENVRSPWIYYESGFVAGHLSTNLICPYLLEQQLGILSDGPLGRFQGTKAEPEDTFRLLKTLNRELLDKGISEAALGGAFEIHWSSLAGSLRRISAMEGETVSSDSFISTDIDQLAGGNLSSEERAMILAIGKDKHGMILVCSDSGGDHFQTGGVDLNRENTARSTALWRAALKGLVRKQVLEMRGNKGEVFNLTGKGFSLFDALNAASSVSG